MDYYQKYQKYKFKYLNLLNQSGGNKDKIKADILKILEQFNDNSNKPSEVDYISNRIDYYVNEIYDFTNSTQNNGIEYINVTQNSILYYYYCKIAVEKNSLELKHVKIPTDDAKYKEYLEVCVIAVKNNGLALKFVKIPIDDTKYEEYLKVCKIAVEKNSLALEFVTVPERLLQTNIVHINKICLDAVTNNVLALKFIENIYINLIYNRQININFISDIIENINKIFEIAIRNNILALEIVTKIYNSLYNIKTQLFKSTIVFKSKLKSLYINICLIAVKNNGNALEHVKIPLSYNDDDENKEYDDENKEYYNLCKEAVKQNGLALKFLKLDEIINVIINYVKKMYYLENEKNIKIEYKKIITNYLFKYKKDISDICDLAVDQNILAFEHVNNIIIIILNINNNIIIIDKEIYFKMCMKVVKEDGNALEHVRKHNLPEETIKDKPYDGDKPYEAICKAAVQQNGFALNHVPTNIIPIVSKQIMYLAVRQNGLVLECINNERYNFAKLGDTKTILVGNIPTKTTYYIIICKEAVKQNGLALKYILKEKMHVEEYNEIRDLKSIKIE